MKTLAYYGIPIALMVGSAIAFTILLTMQHERRETCETAKAVLVADHYCLPKAQLLDLRGGR